MVTVPNAAAKKEAALEHVGVASTDSFKVWSHGYPYRTVRWHFHPEYEAHLITATTGRCFVGDYIGSFEPGNLVLVGPNLPHNWISDLPSPASVLQRCMVLQFTAEVAAGIAALFPEMHFLPGLLACSGRGLLFNATTGAAAAPVMEAMLTAAGPRRLELFFALLGLLHGAEGRRQLASVGYQPRPSRPGEQRLNHALDHIARNLAGDLREEDLSALCGHSASGFSRAFRRHTGMTFVNYVNSLRINRACEKLVGSQDRVTDICYEVGFNNLSNFNRHFLARKAMSPSAYRGCHARQAFGRAEEDDVTADQQAGQANDLASKGPEVERQPRL